jgi:DnaJ-domain-containing protein 1
LGVSEYATEKEMKRAYWRLASLYHPDKVMHLGPRLKQLADYELKKLNEAKSVLLNREKREKYNGELGIVPKTITKTRKGFEINWDTAPDEIELEPEGVKEGEGQYQFCTACGHPNLKGDELCHKCGVQIREFQEVDLSLNDRIRILEKMLQETKISPIKFFEAMRNLESWYHEKNQAARERSMEMRIEILNEKLKNKELSPEKYFEAVTNLREWWQNKSVYQ